MSTILKVKGGGALRGRCSVPGDKSISHRAVMFAALAQGRSHVRGFLDGGDCRATIGVIRGLGINVETPSPEEVIIHGNGLGGLKEPEAVLDCVNSGTTMRLMAGLLAGQSFTSFLVGSEQLQARPMRRVVFPLRQMGARVIGRQQGRFAPLAFGGRRLRGINYSLPIASAQVKSCILLASLFAEGHTTVTEPGPTRDHTERMLSSMGVPVTIKNRSITLQAPTEPLRPFNLTVPGDISSAAFLLAAVIGSPGSQVTVEGVGINPTRDGIVRALNAMGALISPEHLRDVSGEPVASLSIRSSGLHGRTFGGDHIVTMIDELPVLAAIATQAQGTTIIKDATELRVKETDRIATTVEELKKLGAKIEARSDGMVIEGPTQLVGADVHSHGDHRLAMGLTVAGLFASGTTHVHDAHVSSDSFPGFPALMRSLGADIEEIQA